MPRLVVSDGDQMKLTDEQMDALRNINAHMSGWDAGYTAGFKAGAEAMRERAAKECDAADERAYPFACAARIRALPIEDANG